ncbi:MAG: DMT family transporter [Pseudomonadota bacterium]
MADAAAAPPDSARVAQGIGWMAATTLLFVCVTGIVRHVGSEVPAPQAAFIRYLAGTILILPFLSPLLRRPPSAGRLGLHLARGAAHAVGVTLWFYAMARIPIAEVTALGYTAPIFVTIGAALFLGERPKLRRVAAVLAALLGAMVILRPGFQEIGAGQIAQLCAAPAFACSFLIAKRLTDDEDPAVIVALLSVFCTLALLPGAILQWTEPSWTELAWLSLTAVFATAGHWTMTKAYACAPITVTQPVQFLQLVWATILGIAAFGEPIDPFVILGGGIIVGAATFISHRERVAARRAITPTAAQTKS